MSDETSRMNVHEIFAASISSARDEMSRSSLALGISGLAGGMTMGLSAMGVAIGVAFLGEGKLQEFLAMLLYPMGFVAVIIGRAQLFTENTLYPVILVMKEPRQWRDCTRLWAVVLFANFVGILIFSIITSHTNALLPEVRESLGKLGAQSSQHPWATTFWMGVIGGWIIALVAWLVSASHWTSAQIAVVYLLTFLLGAGHFAHCIAGSGEVLTAVLQHTLPVSAYFAWLGPATLGNIFGGVIVVSLLNFGQVHAE